MPSPHRPPPAARRAIKKLGDDMRMARLRRKLTMEIVAQRAATTRPTLSRIEKGDPTVSLGIVAAVLQALNLLDRLADVAEPIHDALGQDISREDLPQRVYRPRARRSQ